MKNAKLSKLIVDMEKKFGKNVIRPASDIKAESLVRVPTGIVALDVQIGGGYPVGRFIQLSGAFSSTKSTTGYHAIAKFQEYFKSIGSDLLVALIQGENGSFTEDYGISIGIDTENMLMNECASMEEALEIARQLQEREICGLIMIDSFEALEPMKEFDSSMDDSVQMGLKPKMFGEYFRKFQNINNKLSREGKHPCTVLGINQLREKIGAYGDPEYEGGGRAIGFASSLTIRLRRGDWITTGTGQNKAIIGQEVRFKVNKSKVSVPQRTGQWEVYLDEGGVVPKGHIDNFKAIVLEGIAYGVVNKAGGWFDFGDVKVQGADNFVEAVRDSPELYEAIKEKTMKLALSKEEDSLAIFKNSLSEEELADYEEYGTIDKAEIALLKEGKTLAEEEIVVKKKTAAKPKAKAKTAPKKKGSVKI